MNVRTLLGATLASSLLLLAGVRSADAQCAPPIIGSVSAPPVETRGIDVSGTVAYIADFDTTFFRTADISDPTAPVIIGSVDLGTTAWDVVVSGSVAYVLTQFSLRCIDVTDPTSPTQIGSLALPNTRDLDIEGSVVSVVGVGPGYLRTIDVSDPTTPTTLGSTTLVGPGPGSHGGRSVTVSGSLAYATTESGAASSVSAGFQIYDISIPAVPVLLGYAIFGHNTTSLALSGTSAFVTGSAGQVKSFDVSDPTAPVLLDTLATGTTAGESLATFGSKLLVGTANGAGGTFGVLDVTDPASMSLLDTQPMSHAVAEIIVAGSVAYTANGDSGLVNLDLSSCLGTSLSLEADTCQMDQDLGKAGLQVAHELWLRNPDMVETTGFQAFLSFNAASMTYEGACSSYDSMVFTSHIQGIATANVATGELRLDGNTGASAGTTGDELLATLIFTVAECDPVSVGFDLTQSFPSELSFDGDALFTTLVDSPSVLVDVTPPSITCPADITVAADADLGDGCQGAIVTWSDPVVSDTCTGVSVVCVPPSGSEFAAGMTETVTCTATDDCGNETMCMFDVTVTETNIVCVDVQLVGVTTAPTRCIRFVTDDCGATADVALTFDGTGLFSGEIEVPCGIWTSLCAKDEQHTQWANGALVLNGTKYELSGGPLELEAGDTDNDGDVDINDVTLFLAQQGGPEPAGTCPWDGSRGADFSNNGNVGSEDFSLMTPQWLTLSSCACTSMLAGDFGDDNVGDRRTSVLVSELDPWVAAQADLNRDRVIDYRDVEIFEQRNGLAKTLSSAMKASALPKSRRTR